MNDTPMTSERLHAVLNSAMVKYVASRTTEDWTTLAEVHPSAIVREMCVKILLQQLDINGLKMQVEDLQTELRAWREAR